MYARAKRDRMSGAQKQGRPPCDRFFQNQDDAKSAVGTAPAGFFEEGVDAASRPTPSLNSNAHTMGRGQELGLYNARFAESGVTCDVLE